MMPPPSVDNGVGISPAIPPRPTPLTVVPENIPESLKQLSQWVCWKYAWSGKKWTKPPYKPSGYKASTTKAENYSGFETVLAAYRNGGFDGIGFCLTTGIVGIDIDNCIDDEGDYNQIALSFLESFSGTYAEISPSGKGIRILCSGSIPRAVKTEVEMYQDGRYLTITGRKVKSGNVPITDKQPALTKAYETYKTKKTPDQLFPSVVIHSDANGWTQADKDLCAKIATSKQGEKFQRLFGGDSSAHNNDNSAADLALCSILSLWCKNDLIQVDRIFRQSKLYRSKWDEKHGAMTYGQMTLQKGARQLAGSSAKCSNCSDSSSSSTEKINLDSVSEDTQRLREALKWIPKDARSGKHDAAHVIGYGCRHNNSKIETHDGAAVCEEWDTRTGGNSLEVFTTSDPDYNLSQPVTVASIYDLALKNGWDGYGPLPEPIPLPSELSPVEPFTFALLPSSLQPWAKDICERMQCPPDFVGVAIMVALSAVLGRKIGIRPQKKTDWTVIANLWGLVVGRPGAMKSPALEAAMAALNRLVAAALKAFTEADEEYQKELAIANMRGEANEKAARKKLATTPDADISDLLSCTMPTAPVLQRYKTNDSTPASLGELLRQNQNGVLVYRDEMVSLLKGLDREDQAEGRGFYLTGWNGDSPYTFDRIGRGLNLHIDAVCLSLLGGTQPGRLSEYIRQAIKGGAADDGLIQRFGLLVWPDNNSTWENVDRYPDTDAKNEAFRVFDYLDKIDLEAIGAQQDKDFNGEPDGGHYLRFDDDAQELFLEWRTTLESNLRGDELSPALESHFAKYKKIIPALALIIHLASGFVGPVSMAATLQALAWGEYLESHARRAYGAGMQQSVATAKAILAKIKSGALSSTGFSSKDVWRPQWSRLTDTQQVNEGLQLLVDYSWLVEKKTHTGGRPSTLFHFTGEGGQ